MRQVRSSFITLLCLGLGLTGCKKKQAPPPNTPGVLDDPENTPAEPETPTYTFQYYPAGCLKPNSGQGISDTVIYAPNMIFPVHRDHNAYLNSQVHNIGGGSRPGNECTASNYDYPWQDTFCEARSGRSRTTLNCPSQAIHQGVDIRGGSMTVCESMKDMNSATRNLVPLVAVEDGVISHIGSMSVNLRTDSHLFKYLHPNMQKLDVTKLQSVSAGDVIGYLSNDFGGAPTTLHLHFEIIANTSSRSWVNVSPYHSLISAYAKNKGPGQEIAAPTPCSP